VTDRQLRRNLALLEEQGLVTQVPTGRPGPGRPPATYLLTELGSAAGLNPTATELA
jgi:predicted ArsR family transcriptional regulator